MTSTAAAAHPSTPGPIEQLFSIVAGVVHFHALRTAVELRLADHLANGPLTVHELAARSGSYAPSLLRLLRVLESIGVLKQSEYHVFSNTALSHLVRKDVPGSQWNFVRAQSPGGGLYEAWCELPDAVRTGKPAFDYVHDCTLWEFLEHNPNQAAIFDEFMRAAQAYTTGVVTAAWDWSRFATIADIGGGLGCQLVDILDAFPSCRGILFERPDVIARAVSHNRVQRVSGDFFRQVPLGADAYVLKLVLHDWPDLEASAILKTIRANVIPTSRVIVIEQVLLESDGKSYSSERDLAMLVYTGGGERTGAQYKQLLEETGFEIEQIISTSTPLSLIISRPTA